MPGSEGEREKPKIHPIICTSEAQSGVQRSTQHYFSPALLNGSPEMISPLSRLHSFFFQSPAMSPGHSDFIQ